MGIWFDLMLGFVGVIVFTILMTWWTYKMLVVDFDHPRVVKMRETKGVARHYFCAIMQCWYMKRGVWYPHEDDEIVKVEDTAEINKNKKFKILELINPHPAEKLVVVDCYMLHRNLKMYRECINFSGHHTQVPPCFMFGYFNKPIVAIGASYFARTRCLGGVHTKQEITVHQDLRPLLTGKFTVEIRGTEYRRSGRGIEGDLRELVFDEHDILVWEGKSQGVALNDTYKPRKVPLKNTSDFDIYKEEKIVSYMDTGYKYGKAVIDWQPQHLSSWVSWMAGFKRPVAHGMWVTAMAVEIITKNETCFQQAYPMHIAVVFRSPMELGTVASVRYDKPKGSNSMTQIRVVNPETERPILDGRMYLGPKLSSVF